jgi:hypothetical protein
MTWRVLLIVLSIIGMSATFMPWIYIPTGDVSIYGYIADGIITGLLFFTALLIVFFQKNKSAFTKASNISLIFIYFFLSFVSLRKIYNFEYNSDNYDEINFLISTALAGTKLGIGVYVLAISSVISLLLTILQYNRATLSSSSKSSITKIAASFLAGMIFLWAFFQITSGQNKDGIETSLKKGFQEMNLAFQTNEIDKFVTYLPPVTFEPMGLNNYTNTIKVARDYMNHLNIGLKSATIDEILHTHQSGKDIQSIAMSKVVFDTPRGDSISVQKTLCISEDKGKNWYYLNVSGKSHKEIKLSFPYLEESLFNYFESN